MTGDDRRGISRRGLLGVFRRGARSLRDGLDDVQRAHSGARGAAPAPESYDRVLRPPDDAVAARAAGAAAWTVDLGGRRMEPGDDVVVRGGGLLEPLVLVRVHAGHWAACTGECPADGSDIRWSAEDDLLRCPACGSEWRMDGESLAGPAAYALARFVVEAYDDDAGGTEIRVHAP